jgi:hypothetical protein
VLNNFEKQIEFRNTMLHGAFIAGGVGIGTLHGKLGKSLSKLTEGMEPINYKKLRDEIEVLESLGADLISAFPG